MGSRSDFWLTVHKLDSDLLKEGATDEERARNICRVLESLAPSTRGVYLENLQSVVSSLSAVARQCKAPV